MDPSSKRQRNYNLSVTRFFLSSSSSRLGVTLVIETLDSKEILIVPSFEEVKGRGGRATLFQGCSKLGELGEEQPHRLIRKEWKGSIPSSFFLSSSLPFFGPSSPVEGANSCIWAWQIAARDPLMMRTNEWHEKD